MKTWRTRDLCPKHGGAAPEKSDWLSRTPIFRSTSVGLAIGFAIVTFFWLLLWSFVPCRNDCTPVASGHVGPVIVSICRCESPDGGRP